MQMGNLSFAITFLPSVFNKNAGCKIVKNEVEFKNKMPLMIA
jgi:hypothetical protein